MRRRRQRDVVPARLQPGGLDDDPDFLTTPTQRRFRMQNAQAHAGYCDANLSVTVLSRRAPARRLIDVDDFVDLFGSNDAIVRADRVRWAIAVVAVFGLKLS